MDGVPGVFHETGTLIQQQISNNLPHFLVTFK